MNRVLENKLKIKMQLHLGSEFEFTRLVDKKGQPIDPFVPKFDIMKITDLTKETKKSQKINVQSPRFVSTLERALIKLCTECDDDHSGELDYKQFKEAFLNLDEQYMLCKEDVQCLLALADETPSGKINWKDFIPTAILAIQIFLDRNKRLAKQPEALKEINRDTLKLIFENEIRKANTILQRRFSKHDKEATGKITFSDCQKAFHATSWLTPKEVNLLLRSYQMKYGYDEIEYADFEKDLYDVRYSLAASRIMDTNAHALEENLIEECSK